MNANKFISCAEAVAMIPDGASIMIGGFIGVGSPHRIIAEMVRQGLKNLTIIANDTGTESFGIGRLVMAKMIRRLVASHIGLNPETQRQVIAGEIEAEFCPQGTLAERIRAGGFGLGGILTPTGIGTVVAEGKQVIEVDGRQYLLEKADRWNKKPFSEKTLHPRILRISDNHFLCQLSVVRVDFQRHFTAGQAEKNEEFAHGYASPLFYGSGPTIPFSVIR